MCYQLGFVCRRKLERTSSTEQSRRSTRRLRSCWSSCRQAPGFRRRQQWNAPQQGAQRLQRRSKSQWKHTYLGTKIHHSQRRDRILLFFLRPEIGQFSPHFSAISLLHCTVNPETLKKYPLEKIQEIQWRRRPEIADFCPLSWSNVS